MGGTFIWKTQLAISSLGCVDVSSLVRGPEVLSYHFKYMRAKNMERKNG